MDAQAAHVNTIISTVFIDIPQIVPRAHQTIAACGRNENDSGSRPRAAGLVINHCQLRDLSQYISTNAPQLGADDYATKRTALLHPCSTQPSAHSAADNGAAADTDEEAAGRSRSRLASLSTCADASPSCAR
jgi:hypothetical protein